MELTQRIADEVEPARTKVATLFIFGTAHTVYSGINHIGRDPNKSDVFIDNPTVSKTHAVIRVFDNQHVILDLASSNKTTIETQEEPLIPFDQYDLKHKCSIQFGEVRGEYCYDEIDSQMGLGSPDIVRPANPLEKIFNREKDSQLTTTFETQDLLVEVRPSSPIIDSQLIKRKGRRRAKKSSDSAETQSQVGTNAHDIFIHDMETQQTNSTKVSVTGSDIKQTKAIHDMETQALKSNRTSVPDLKIPTDTDTLGDPLLNLSDQLQLSESLHEDTLQKVPIEAKPSRDSSFYIPETQDVRNSLLSYNTSKNISIADSQCDIMETHTADDNSNDIINYKEDSNMSVSDCNFDNVSSQCLLRSFTVLPNCDEEKILTKKSDILIDCEDNDKTDKASEARSNLGTGKVEKISHSFEKNKQILVNDSIMDDQETQIMSCNSPEIFSPETTPAVKTSPINKASLDFFNQPTQLLDNNVGVLNAECSPSFYDIPTQIFIPQNTLEEVTIKQECKSVSSREGSFNSGKFPSMSNSPVASSSDSFYNKATQIWTPNDVTEAGDKNRSEMNNSDLYDQLTQIFPGNEVILENDNIDASTAHANVSGINNKALGDPDYLNVSTISVINDETKYDKSSKIKKYASSTPMVVDKKKPSEGIHKKSNEEPTSNKIKKGKDHDTGTSGVTSSKNVSGGEDKLLPEDSELQAQASMVDTESVTKRTKRVTKKRPKDIVYSSDSEEDLFPGDNTRPQFITVLPHGKQGKKKVPEVTIKNISINNSQGALSNPSSGNSNAQSNIVTEAVEVNHSEVDNTDLYEQLTQIFPGNEIMLENNTIDEPTASANVSGKNNKILEDIDCLSGSTLSEIKNETKYGKSSKKEKYASSTPMDKKKHSEDTKKKTNKESASNKLKKGKDHDTSGKSSVTSLKDLSEEGELLEEDSESELQAQASMALYVETVTKPVTKEKLKDMFGDSSDSESDLFIGKRITKAKNAKLPLRGKQEKQKVPEVTYKSPRTRKRAKNFDELFGDSESQAEGEIRKCKNISKEKITDSTNKDLLLNIESKSTASTSLDSQSGSTPSRPRRSKREAKESSNTTPTTSAVQQKAGRRTRNIGLDHQHSKDLLQPSHFDIVIKEEVIEEVERRNEVEMSDSPRTRSSNRQKDKQERSTDIQVKPELTSPARSTRNSKKEYNHLSESTQDNIMAPENKVNSRRKTARGAVGQDAAKNSDLMEVENSQVRAPSMRGRKRQTLDASQSQENLEIIDVPVKRQKPNGHDKLIPSPRVASRYEQKDKYRILFTSVNDGHLVKLAKSLGGSVVENYKQCTVLIAPRIVRTVKFLCCLAKGIPIVSADWLVQSSKAKKFLDPWLFITSDKVGESKYKFDLAKSLKRAQTTALLKGYTVMGTASIVPQVKETQDIVESSGGKFITRAPSRGFKEPSFIISCDADRAQWPKNKKVIPPIVTAECLLIGILQQILHLELHTLT